MPAAASPVPVPSSPRPVPVATAASPPGLPLPPPVAAQEPEPSNEALGNRIAEAAACIQAATYELLVLIRQFDERAGWEGFASYAHWLSWRIGLAPGPAREHVRVARALADLPRLSAAMQRGQVSYSKVRAVTRVATPETEQDLLDLALAGTAAHVEQVVRSWRRVDRAAEAADDRQRHDSRALDTWVDDDGMVVVRGRLTPELGAVLRRALDAAMDAAPSPVDADGAAADTAAGMAPSVSQRRADALGTVAECALAGGLDKGTAGDRYQMVVHVDSDTLADDTPADADDGRAAAVTAPRPSDGPGAAGTRAGDEPDTRTSSCPSDGTGNAGTRAGDEPDARMPPRLGGRTDDRNEAVMTTVGPATLAPYVPAGTYGRRSAGEDKAADETAPAAAQAAAPLRSDAAPPTPVRPASSPTALRVGMAGTASAATQTTDAPQPATARPTTHHAIPCAGVPATPQPATERPAAPTRGQSALDEAGGIRVSAETARRLACDAARVTLQHGPAGQILSVGRRTRTLSPALRRALAARDRHCRFPGCTATRCDGHHIRHWARGGATALDNLVLLCRRHHRAVHEEGFGVTLGDDGEAHFVRPDGEPLPEAPASPTVTGAPLAPMTARLARAGIRFGPHTATPAWRGERLDVDWAVSVLWRRRGG